MDDLEANLVKEAELEAQLSEIQKQLLQVRAANRDDVIADVKAKIKRYSITRTELAAAFPVLRKKKGKTSDDTTLKKRRPRKPKDGASGSAS